MRMSQLCRHVAVLLSICVGNSCGLARNFDDRPEWSKVMAEPDATLVTAIEASDRDALRKAIATGANVDARGRHNITPLMLAIDRLDASLVADLLGYGANPNLKASDGAGPVSLAVENYRQAPEILELILAAGGDPNTRRPNGDPVIMRFVNDHNCDYLRWMHERGANLDITTRAGDPIITDAAVGQDWDVVWCLIELGAQYNPKGARQPLQQSLAIPYPSPDSPLFPYKTRVREFLRSRGVEVYPLD